MQDRITKLCSKLLNTEEPTDVHPTAEQLRSAIAEKVWSIRAEVQDVALKLLHEGKGPHSQEERVIMEADHVHRRQDERSNEASLA